MEINIVNALYGSAEAFFQSSFFHYIRIIAGFIIAILLIADILLLSKRLQGDVKVALFGSKAPRFKKSKYTKKWEDIKKGVEEGGISNGKISVIKADEMLSEVLGMAGYKGKNTEEKISEVKPGQLLGIEEALRAHEVYKRIVKDPSYQTGIDELRSALQGYEGVLRGLEVIE